MAIVLQLLVLGVVIACAIWAIVSDLRKASEAQPADQAPHRKPWIHFGMLVVAGGMMLGSSELALEGLGLLTAGGGFVGGLGGLAMLAGSFVFLFGLIDKYLLHRGQPVVPVRRIRSVLHGLVAGCILLPIFVIVGGTKPPAGTTTTAQAGRFTDQAGRYSIEAPAGWIENPELLHQGAIIGLSDVADDLHVTVLATRKEDLVTTSLRECAAVSLEQLSESFSAVETTLWNEALLNGQPAFQCELHCTSGNVRLSFVVVCVETPTHICEIRAWSTNSQFRKNRQTLETIIQSFAVK